MKTKPTATLLNGGRPGREGEMDQGRGDLKSRVRKHWELETCGTRYGMSISRKDYFDEISRARYKLEPYILEFADFQTARCKRILEIGVGAGSDFFNWVNNGAIATGLDFTESAIALTRERFEVNHVSHGKYILLRADAEKLPFDDNKFDLVYSWGVLHHTPNTELAFKEAFRVLKPNGTLKAMIYHIPSWSGWALWAQHALLKGRLFQSVRQVIFAHLESPGTKVYTTHETKRMLNDIGFNVNRMVTKLGPGDLLIITPSQKYQHPIFKLIWKLYPRWLIKKTGDRLGLYLLIDAVRPRQ